LFCQYYHGNEEIKASTEHREIKNIKVTVSQDCPISCPGMPRLVQENLKVQKRGKGRYPSFVELINNG
jgi:hypothetical protein